MTYLDATRIVRRKGESQNSYLTYLTDAEYMKNQDCPRYWFRDLACRRIARSPLSTELQAADKAQERVQDTNTWNVNGQIVLLSEALNLDSKTLLDDVFRSEASVLTCQTYIQSDDSQYVTFPQKTLLHWYHSDAQLIDVMQKSSGSDRNIFEEFFNRDCDASFFDPWMCSTWKRQIEELDLLEAHSDLNSDSGALYTSVVVIQEICPEIVMEDVLSQNFFGCSSWFTSSMFALGHGEIFRSKKTFWINDLTTWC